MHRTTFVSRIDVYAMSCIWNPVGGAKGQVCDGE